MINCWTLQTKYSKILKFLSKNLFDFSSISFHILKQQILQYDDYIRANIANIKTISLPGKKDSFSILFTNMF